MLGLHERQPLEKRIVMVLGRRMGGRWGRLWEAAGDAYSRRCMATDMGPHGTAWWAIFRMQQAKCLRPRRQNRVTERMTNEEQKNDWHQRAPIGNTQQTHTRCSKTQYASSV
jgi:hypothetical protein